MKESLQFEDDVARMFKNLRDTTGGIIILLHHLTKESESKWNKAEGYEPKLIHIRGSSRISDFANQVLLLHRPDHYDDLVEIAKMAGKNIHGAFQVDVAANRDGEEKKIQFKHELAFCHFSE
jgi:replicative DNA helicase